jgi:AcrR family transcriptional regulator
MELPVKLSKSAAKARATRHKIIEAARVCFLRDGYGSTTIKAIAAVAGVAPQTIYFVFHNKVSILNEVLDLTIAGDEEPIAVKDRPWVDELRRAKQAGQAAALLAVEAGAIVARTAPLFRVIRGASAEPEVDALLEENKRQRSETLDLVAQIVSDAGLVATDEHQRYFADVLYTVMSEECYSLLVEERGWTPSRWKQWLEQVLTWTLVEGTSNLDSMTSPGEREMDASTAG